MAGCAGGLQQRRPLPEDLVVVGAYGAIRGRRVVASSSR